MTSLYDKWSETEKITHTKLNYSNKLPLKEQVLFEHKNVKLLNVSKTYCNILYIGVNFLFSVKKDLLKIIHYAILALHYGGHGETYTEQDK